MEEKIVKSVTGQEYIEDTSNHLSRGLSILYPTDTIWGLGCDATNESAVQYIREIKNAPFDYPMVILVNTIQMIKDYAAYIHPRVETLLLHHEQPLTLLYDAHENAPVHLLSDQNRIAIRLCKDEFCNNVIYDLGRPIIATAASLYNAKPPAKFKDVSEELKKKVDIIVDFNIEAEEARLPSIIASFNHKGDLEFIRK